MVRLIYIGSFFSTKDKKISFYFFKHRRSAGHVTIRHTGHTSLVRCRIRIAFCKHEGWNCLSKHLVGICNLVTSNNHLVDERC